MDGVQQIDKLHIFLSHKLIDEGTATEIARALRIKGARGVEVNFSGEKKHFGQDYNRWISEKLETADWYILAYTEPSANWDWCLYEAGYFEAVRQRDQNEAPRVICIHPADDVPKPLSRFDSVSVDKPWELERFCENFFESVNPDLPTDDKQVEYKDLSNRITTAFRARTITRYTGPCIYVRIPEPGAISPRALPDAAMVNADKETMSQVFQIGKDTANWYELKSRYGATKDKRWVAQLAQAVKDIDSHCMPAPITGRIEIANSGRSFHPVLDRVNELSDESFECRLTLAPGLTGAWAESVDARTQVLLAALRMTVRFRYDFLARYSGKLPFIMSTEGAKPFRENFRSFMFDITSEAEAHGLSSQEVLLACFDDEDDRREIGDMYELWEKDIMPMMFNAIGMSVDPEVWTTFDDKPLSHEHAKALEEAFKKLRSLNTSFLQRALKRFEYLISLEKA